MAFTVPERLAAGRGGPTAGERKVFEALRDHLPEDYLVYYDIRVNGQHPDFIVIGPDLGIVVLEVKDWRLSTIAGTSGDGVLLKTADGEELVRHPLHQARSYVHGAVDLLKARPALRKDGRLCCAWGFGAVLAGLRTADIQVPSLLGPTLEDALGRGLVLSADDLAADRLLPRLRALVPPWGHRLPPLTPAQIDEIRAAIHPEIRLGWAHGDDEILDVMDREQEQLARSLGDGHRLLRGVAGSGKTVTLIARARHLRQRHPEWRILVLCFNTVLAGFLRQQIGIDDALEVQTFHAWCTRRLRDAGVDLPPRPARGRPWDEYWQGVPALLLDAYSTGKAPTGTYQAVLVDEGQDFADDWYRTLLQALDPATSSLFVALDASQDIYRRKVSWRTLGIHAAGRSRVLRVNYRNTRQIMSAAYAVIRELDSAEQSAPASDEAYVVPERALRSGPLPEVHRHPDGSASRAFALDWIRARVAQGVSPESILVLSLGRPEVTAFTAWLEKAGVSAAAVGARPRRASVRTSTIHSAKGLDADHVLVLGGHQLDGRQDDEGRRLLYIAMTRARQQLCVCYHGASRLMTELEAVLRPSSS